MSTSKTYKIGDLVELKSGGPIMTIHSENTNTRTGNLIGYYCQWFAGKKLEVGKFPADSLQAVSKDTK
jgi:uncharacterized protein YodC (DUF2158 family)